MKTGEMRMKEKKKNQFIYSPEKVIIWTVTFATSEYDGLHE